MIRASVIRAVLSAIAGGLIAVGAFSSTWFLVSGGVVAMITLPQWPVWRQK